MWNLDRTRSHPALCSVVHSGICDVDRRVPPLMQYCNLSKLILTNEFPSASRVAHADLWRTLAGLPALRSLECYGVRDLDDSLGQLTSLTSLVWADRDTLRPACIAALTALTALSCIRCPTVAAAVPTFTRLTSLESLRLERAVRITSSWRASRCSPNCGCWIPV